MLGNPGRQCLSMVAAGFSPQTPSGEPGSLGLQRSPPHRVQSQLLPSVGLVISAPCSAPGWPCHRPSARCSLTGPPQDWRGLGHPQDGAQC